ncbi:RNA polymerase sigma factor [Actinorugispora endophytica]|uniref:RNA polymerase ECF family sigma subunit n=1 Tax=Actinorugispora endophytica TaxID=1605990 RepID=A0A4R6V158_9ACTN|nr:sigma-70 family RNA polymerase sigma factor [Actinorugispora endophytica]TDQ53613.1 RNA polymerase ECF family sigma subunit [Actinorugispora endophytica]
MPRDAPASAPEDSVTRFEALYDTCYGDVLGYLLRRLDHPEAAADLVADVFVTVWNRIGDVPPAPQARPWVFGVARRVLANHRRGARRGNALAARLRLELGAAAVSRPDWEDQAVADIGRVFRTLSDKDQEVLTLAAWEALDPGQIAVVLGCARGTARVRLHRARGRFARALRGAGLDVASCLPPEPPPAARRTPKGALR